MNNRSKRNMLIRTLTPLYISTLGIGLVILGIFFAPETKLDAITNLGYLCITGGLALAEPNSSQKEDKEEILDEIKALQPQKKDLGDY